MLCRQVTTQSSKKLFFQPTNKLTNKQAFSKAISWFQKAIVFLYEPKAQLLGKMKGFLLSDQTLKILFMANTYYEDSKVWKGTAKEMDGNIVTAGAGRFIVTQSPHEENINKSIRHWHSWLKFWIFQSRINYIFGYGRVIVVSKQDYLHIKSSMETSR